MSFSERRLKAVPVLIVLNVLVFLYTKGLIQHPRFQGMYALSALGLEAGRWWQIVTHAFLHGSVLHLVFNMMGLWFAGRVVERVMGIWRFVALYLTAAIVGGLFQIAFSGRGPLIGASGAVFGVLIAFSMLFPQSKRVVILFFVPMRLRAKYLGMGLALSSFLLLLTGLFPGIGHAAHFGGCVAGYFFVRLTARRVLRPWAPPGSTAAVEDRYPEQANHRNLHHNPG